MPAQLTDVLAAGARTHDERRLAAELRKPGLTAAIARLEADPASCTDLRAADVAAAVEFLSDAAADGISRADERETVRAALAARTARPGVDDAVSWLSSRPYDKALEAIMQHPIDQGVAWARNLEGDERAVAYQRLLRHPDLRPERSPAYAAGTPTGDLVDDITSGRAGLNGRDVERSSYWHDTVRGWAKASPVLGAAELTFALDAVTPGYVNAQESLVALARNATLTADGHAALVARTDMPAVLYAFCLPDVPAEAVAAAAGVGPHRLEDCLEACGDPAAVSAAIEQVPDGWAAEDRAAIARKAVRHLDLLTSAARRRVLIWLPPQAALNRLIIAAGRGPAWFDDEIGELRDVLALPTGRLRGKDLADLSGEQLRRAVRFLAGIVNAGRLVALTGREPALAAACGEIVFELAGGDAQRLRTMNGLFDGWAGTLAELAEAAALTSD